MFIWKCYPPPPSSLKDHFLGSKVLACKSPLASAMRRVLWSSSKSLQLYTVFGGPQASRVCQIPSALQGGKMGTKSQRKAGMVDACSTLLFHPEGEAAKVDQPLSVPQVLWSCSSVPNSFFSQWLLGI